MIYIVSPYTSYATGDVNRRLEQHARFEQAAKYVALLYRDGERCWSSIVHGHAIKAVVSNIPAEYPFWQRFAAIRSPAPIGCTSLCCQGGTYPSVSPTK